MDRDTIERCAKVVDTHASHYRDKFMAENGKLTEQCVCYALETTAKAIRALPSEPPASHAIITKLTGYAGHDNGMPPCDALALGDDCTCGYSEAIAEARVFMKGDGDE